jgi:TetR/AcrR family transcriptional repressor of nem operon
MSTRTDPPAAERVFTAKGLATRARIVAAAAELVFEIGVAATAVEDVQKKAGVSSSQLYHYFTDKQHLMRAVVDHQARLAVDLQAPLEPLDSVKALESWVDFHLILQGKRGFVGGCKLGSLVSQVAEADPVARSGLSEGFATWEKTFIDGLRAMRERGDLAEQADPERLGMALMAAFEGGLMLSQAQRSIAPLESALGTVLDHIRLLATPQSGTHRKS